MTIRNGKETNYPSVTQFRVYYCNFDRKETINLPMYPLQIPKGDLINKEER